MSWRVARALLTLKAEIDAAHPGRPTSADGTIGDARHQAEVSDHNPNSAGVVTAWDITTDLPWTAELAENLRLKGGDGDQRVKYVIYRGRIASAIDGWTWRPYSGYSQHFDHIHLSVSADPRQYDRTDPWFPLTHGAGRIPSSSFPTSQEEYVATLDPADKAEIIQAITGGIRPADHHDTDTRYVSNADLLTALEALPGKIAAALKDSK